MGSHHRARPAEPRATPPHAKQLIVSLLSQRWSVPSFHLHTSGTVTPGCARSRLLRAAPIIIPIIGRPRPLLPSPSSSWARHSWRTLRPFIAALIFHSILHRNSCVLPNTAAAQAGSHPSLRRGCVGSRPSACVITSRPGSPEPRPCCWHRQQPQKITRRSMKLGGARFEASAASRACSAKSCLASIMIRPRIPTRSSARSSSTSAEANGLLGPYVASLNR